MEESELNKTKSKFQFKSEDNSTMKQEKFWARVEHLSYLGDLTILM